MTLVLNKKNLSLMTLKTLNVLKKVVRSQISTWNIISTLKEIMDFEGTNGRMAERSHAHTSK